MRSVFYGVLLTVFVAGAGYVQAANDQDYISISDEPAFKPKSTVYSDKKKKTKSSTGDDYISISDEPAFTPKPINTGDDDYISISDESVITPKPSTGIADGNASAGECGKGKQLCRDGFCRVSCETSDGLGTAFNDVQGGEEYGAPQGVEPARSGEAGGTRAIIIDLNNRAGKRVDAVVDGQASLPVLLKDETGGSNSVEAKGGINYVKEGQPPRQ